MSGQFDKLAALLKELFQTDQADLDFGIYRVINQRREEINQFLDEELLPQVKAAFSEYQSIDKDKLNEEMQKAIKQAEELGVDPEETKKVKEIREQLANFSVDIDDLEKQVYSALYNFFRRYYDEGDFISQRRYKEGVYAIPYEGEEVKLYWANHDQYYIKTSEYFRNYSFKLPSGKLAHFKLTEADTEKDNRKEIEDKKRRFILAEELLTWEKDSVVIHFEFRPDEEKRNQSKCNQDTLEKIFRLHQNLNEQVQKDSLAELATPAPTESNPDRTLLEKHLEDYTRRNTQDYFIHKDLSKFLRRELDFFIKNEVMHLDNIEHDSSPRVEQYLSKVKVIRQIAHQIVDFLAQIENFQKKLWMKKKFVLDTNYCMTLDRVPEELYSDIATNDAQREEWVRLFAIDEIKGDMFKANYTNPLTVDFLKANLYLLVDTKFYGDEFRFQVIASIRDLDEELDGLLIHCENFQAINLIKHVYPYQIGCIYIDPPFNSPSTEILYKNNYKHSTWLSLMHDRIRLSKQLLTQEGSFIVAIDENEHKNLQFLIDALFEGYDIVDVAIEHNRKGIQGDHFSYTNEFAIFAIPYQLKELNRVEREEDDWDWTNLRNWGGESLRSDGANCFYPIYVDDAQIVGFGDVCPDDFHPQSSNVELENGLIAVYPIDRKGVERKWRYEIGTVESIQNLLKVESSKDGEKQIKKAKADDQFKTMWYSPKYNAGDYGTNLLTNMGINKEWFSFPKSLYTVKDCIFAVSDESALTIDYFAGSGTTGHAIIDLNRDDGGHRKYILVEMGLYFDTVLKPRIQKAIYSKDWRDGKPASRNGISHAFKYIKLESYEDTLNNLELTLKGEQAQALIDAKEFRGDYLLRYMLEVESQGSLLDIQAFETPFDYQLEIASSTVGETIPTKVDLVETFNYLLGLHVKTIRNIEGCVVVHGRTRDDRQVLVIWRHVSEMDNTKLEAFFQKHIAEALEGITDIYVNGDNNLAILRPSNEHWKVQLTEESFHHLMFDV